MWCLFSSKSLTSNESWSSLVAAQWNHATSKKAGLLLSGLKSPPRQEPFLLSSSDASNIRIACRTSNYKVQATHFPQKPTLADDMWCLLPSKIRTRTGPCARAGCCPATCYKVEATRRTAYDLGIARGSKTCSASNLQRRLWLFRMSLASSENTKRTGHERAGKRHQTKTPHTRVRETSDVDYEHM